MIKSYEDAIAYIHGRQKWKKTPSFHRIERLLAALGNPHLGLKFVHITGTNGKGSTSEMTAALLRAAGLRVGLFTSPFITRFNERIQDDDGQIPDDKLTNIMQRIEPIVDALDEELPSGGPTEFETLTVLMFVYFAENPVDVVVLEVGVGGTWDTTNVIPEKLVSVITTVGLDHMAVLGHTIAEIAAQKAGIIRPNAPVVLGRLPKEAMEVIIRRAELLDAPLSSFGKEYSGEFVPATSDWGQVISYGDESEKFEQLSLNLMGNYQLENAAVAIKTALITVDKLGKTLDQSQINAALSNVAWPARFERVAQHPTVVLDGAHNLPGVTALVDTLETRFADRKIYVLFSALTDKNYLDMVEMLAKQPNVKLSIVGFQAPASRIDINPHEVASALIDYDVNAHDSWEAGFQSVSTRAKDDDLILFTGSLYFVSEVRAFFMS
jgi:dihydrofolate synthase/folylpolyglutamate synthase